LRLRQLGLRNGLLLQSLELATNERNRFHHALRRRVQLDAKVAAIVVRVERAADAVDEPALLPQLLPQTRLERAAAAEYLIENQERVVIGVGARDRRLPEPNVDLTGGGPDVVVTAGRRRDGHEMRIRLRPRCLPGAERSLEIGAHPVGRKVSDDGDRREVGPPIPRAKRQEVLLRNSADALRRRLAK